MSEGQLRGQGDTREEIETVVRAARYYVQPSDDLRPRTIEAAHQWCNDRRAEQKLFGLMLAALLLLALSSPAIQYVDVMLSRVSAPSASEIQDRAIQYGAHPHIGANWGMAEAFTQLRRAQATRLGQSIRSIR